MIFFLLFGSETQQSMKEVDEILTKYSGFSQRKITSKLVQSITFFNKSYYLKKVNVVR